MAPLLRCGFELGSATSGMELPGTSSFFGGATVNNAGAGYSQHGGEWSMRIDAPSSGVAQGCSHIFASVNQDIALARFYLGSGIDGVSVNAKTSICVLYSLALTPIVWISLDASGNVIYETEDETLLTLPGGSFVGEVWQGFQFLFFRVNGAGSDVLIIRSIGPHEGESPDFIFTGKSFSAGIAVMAVGVNLRGETATAGRFYFDDLAVNDSTGSFQASWPGPGKITHLNIDADGDQANDGTIGTDFDTYPTTGGTPYQQLDEAPTPDDDTSGLALLTGSSGLTDPPVLDFNLEACAAAGIPANARINVVGVGVRYRNINGDNPAYLITRLKSGSGGTVVESNPQRNLIASRYVTSRLALPQNLTLTSAFDPDTAARPWSPSLLDTAQIGVRMTLPGVGTTAT